MKFAFYASGQATRSIRTLKALGARARSVAFVLTDTAGNAELKASCAAAKVKLIESDRGAGLSDRLDQELKGHSADYLFVWGTRILKGKLLEDFSLRIVNFHPSLLPSFPGLNSVDQALEAGSFLLGNSAHFIDAGVDTGPVIQQSLIHRSAYQDYDSVLDLQIPMALQIMAWLEAGRVQVKGKSVVVKGASYAPGAFIPALESEPV